MKKAEIEKYVRSMQTTFETTEIIFTNGSKWFGFFENNPFGGEVQTADNNGTLSVTFIASISM